MGSSDFTKILKVKIAGRILQFTQGEYWTRPVTRDHTKSS